MKEFEPNLFHDEEYPLNFIFYQWALNQIPDEGAIIGYTEEPKFTDHKSPQQVLVWEQGMVVGRVKRDNQSS